MPPAPTAQIRPRPAFSTSRRIFAPASSMIRLQPRTLPARPFHRIYRRRGDPTSSCPAPRGARKPGGQPPTHGTCSAEPEPPPSVGAGRGRLRPDQEIGPLSDFRNLLPDRNLGLRSEPADLRPDRKSRLRSDRGQGDFRPHLDLCRIGTPVNWAPAARPEPLRARQIARSQGHPMTHLVADGARAGGGMPDRAGLAGGARFLPQQLDHPVLQDPDLAMSR